MRTCILLAAAVLLLAGCESTGGVYRAKPSDQHGAELSRDFMIGKWLGQAPMKEGGSKMWLVERSADGTFTVTFRNISPSGVVEEEAEYGDWGLSGDVYFTMTRGWIRNGRKDPVTVRESYFDDAYIVEKLTAEEFVYRSVAAGDTYTARKVPDSYQLP